MKFVWKNSVIDITLLVTVVVAVSCFIFILMGSTPVWADTSTGDVYEIPEDYVSRNYIIQGRTNSNGQMYFTDPDGGQSMDNYTQVIDYYYDFTVYYPKDFYLSLVITSGAYQKNYYSLWLEPFNDDARNLLYGYSFGSGLKFDDNNMCMATSDYTDSDGNKSSVVIYIKKNNCNQYSIQKTENHGILEKEIALSLSSLDGYLNMSQYSLFSVNYPFIFRPYSGYDKLIYSGIYGNDYMVQKIQCSSYDTLDTDISALRCVEKRISNDNSGTFPEPELDSVIKRTNRLSCFYKFPTQNRLPNFEYVYPKIYIKESGKDWAEYPEEDLNVDSTYRHVLNFTVDSSNRSIWCSLMFNALYLRMGYTIEQVLADDFEPPKIDGIIWGVQYGYALTQNILDESSIRKSKIVFSRYVFEDNIVDTPDVGIGDLGDLPNISGSTSNIEVETGSSGTSGGSLNRPSGGHDVSDYDSTSFIDLILNGKLSFSSIGDALSSLFSMVSGFASAVGSILGAVFGNAFGLIALCAVGAVIVLRVLGR